MNYCDDGYYVLGFIRVMNDKETTVTVSIINSLFI